MYNNNNNIQINNNNQTRGIRPTPKCRVKCNTSFKICLRHYERTVAYNGDCSYGEVIVAPNEYSKIHQIKFNFTWMRDFSLILEAFHTSGSGRYATKKRLLLHSFQEAIEVSPDWKEETIRTNQTTITAKIRVLCDRYYYGKDCSQKCSPRNDRYGHYECDEKGKKCLSGWKGDYCDIPICAEGCRNGTCKTPGKCDCSEGYEGALCDKCRVYPGCQHGSCKKPWECNCEDGWGGSFCDKDLNYCTRHRPCVNGLCFNTGQGSYTCECVLGFTGVNCDIPVSDCSTAPCRNGGTCSQSPPGSNYTCDCPLGFTGLNCEKPISASCNLKPCENGGTCSNGPSGYLCICPPGYSGVNCENRLNHCDQSPCLNGATCQPSRFSSSSYICNCRAGFNGTHCENNIDDCVSDSLCFNGGTCIDGDNSYTCLCNAGFTGPNCQSVIRSSDYCSSNPCSNGGQCTDLDNGFYCKCLPGYAGTDCSIRIREISEKFLEEDGPDPSFGNYLSKSQTAMISVILCIIPFVLLYILSLRRIRAQERQRYENEEAIRQNVENSAKKCLQNNVFTRS